MDNLETSTFLMDLADNSEFTVSFEEVRAVKLQDPNQTADTTFFCDTYTFKK